MKYGSWWALQRNGGFSLGIHIEWRTRLTNQGVRYGPYVDLHIIQWVISLGRNPIWAGEHHLKASYARGGKSADNSSEG